MNQGPSILLYLNYLYYILYSLITGVYFAFVSSLNSCHSRNPCLLEAFEMFVQGNACLFQADNFHLGCFPSPGLPCSTTAKLAVYAGKKRAGIAKTPREAGNNMDISWLNVSQSGVCVLGYPASQERRQPFQLILGAKFGLLPKEKNIDSSSLIYAFLKSRFVTLTAKLPPDLILYNMNLAADGAENECHGRKNSGGVRISTI